MLGLNGYVRAQKQKKALQFLKINFMLVIGFALAYRLADHILYIYPDLAHRWGLGSIKKVNSLYSFLYFSLITQSGVGFSGILPDGNNVITTNSLLIKILSLMQLVSVILMLAWSV
jgi:hypothetical protein